VDVLGPLRARGADGTDCTPDGALQRRLLALLVLRRGHVLPVDMAVEALWPSGPPANPAASLQSHVSRLRRCLPDGAVSSGPDGYRLDPSVLDVDADRIPELLERMPETADVIVEAEVDELLARWQGPAYPELDDVDDGRAEAARLDELRTAMREARAERRLETGRLEGLVSELRRLADEAPLRERPRSLMMRALAAAGRRVDALRAYDDFRRLLSDELGIEPSPLLVQQHAELLTGDGPVAAPTELPSHVPATTTTLLGRGALLSDVLDAASRHRVVTLVGPGGVGKTRLLLEAGHRLRDQDTRSVVLCELAPTFGEAAADRVAAALGIDARPGVSAASRIASVVGERHLVVLLDNCEHVLEPVAELVEQVLADCRNVRFVATSRERLRVQGEAVRVVPPLDVDGSSSTAVQLFLERGRAVAPGFEPSADDLEVIADVTRRLDGLPLAIELAAARLHTHDLAEVAAGLDARFALLSEGFRRSDRHGSLHAAVSWSYDLLDDQLQQVLVDLAVFNGTFDAADVAVVCDLDATTAADALARLVERSLVMRVPGRRHVLLETIRAFAAEQLASSGRVDTVNRRHADHHIERVWAAQRTLADHDSQALAAMDALMPELRAAVGWMLDHGDVEGAGLLVGGLIDYGFFRLRPDALVLADAVVDADPDDRSPHAALMWAAKAYAAWMAGDLREHDRCAERAVRVGAGPVGELGPDVHPEVPTVRGNTGLFAGRLDEATEWYGKAMAAAGTDRIRRAFACSTALLALAYSGDPAAARAAEDLLSEMGDDASPCAAYAWYAAGEAVAEADPALAADRYALAVEIAGRTHTSAVTGLAGASKASIDARHGDLDVAADAYRELLAHWRRAGMWPTQWTMLRSVAGLLARRGAQREAAVLEGAVRSTNAGHEIFGADEEALIELGTTLRAELGDEAYDAARAEGSHLDGDAAVDLALRCL
jgi:predicted ATPase/DNA-binding SARP family transcriptional activator